MNLHEVPEHDGEVKDNVAADEKRQLPSPQEQRSWFRNCYETADESKWGVRRFESLALLNLCYYQHELEELEKKFREADGELSPSDLLSLRSLMKEYGSSFSTSSFFPTSYNFRLERSYKQTWCALKSPRSSRDGFPAPL